MTFHDLRYYPWLDLGCAPNTDHVYVTCQRDPKLSNPTVSELRKDDILAQSPRSLHVFGDNIWAGETRLQQDNERESQTLHGQALSVGNMMGKTMWISVVE